MEHSQNLSPSSNSSQAARNSETSGKVGAAIESASDAIQTVADNVTAKVNNEYERVQKYVREADLQSAFSDVKKLAAKHPLSAAAVGVGFGMLIGRLFRRG